MATSAFVDIFTVNSADAVNTTYVRTGYGFQPKGIIVFTTGRSETVDTGGSSDMRTSIGFGSSTTRRGCHAGSEFDAQASAVNNSIAIDNTAILTTISSGDAVDGRLDISSFDADGMTFIVDDQFPVTIRVLVFAFGGTDITNVEVDADNSSPSATGNFTVNNTDNFTPTITFLTVARGNIQAAVNTVHNAMSFGVAMSSTKRWSLSGLCEDGVATMDTYRYMTDIECVARHASTNTVGLRWDFVSNNTGPGGVTMNQLEGGANKYMYMMVGGGNWDMGTLSTRTDTNNIVVSGLAFQPNSVLFMSHCTTESTQDTTQNDFLFSIGAAKSATTRYAMGATSQDALADSEVATYIEHDEVYVKGNLADGIDALMDVVSIDTTGFTCVMDDTEPTAGSFVGWVALGDSAATTVNPINGTHNLVGQTMAVEVIVDLFPPNGIHSLVGQAQSVTLEVQTDGLVNGVHNLIGQTQAVEIIVALDLERGNHNIIAQTPTVEIEAAADFTNGVHNLVGQTQEAILTSGLDLDPTDERHNLIGNTMDVVAVAPVDVTNEVGLLSLVAQTQSIEADVEVALIDGFWTLVGIAPSITFDVAAPEAEEELPEGAAAKKRKAKWRYKYYIDKITPNVGDRV